MNDCYIDKGNGTIMISEWYRGSFMSVRRDALPAEHKQSFYSCLKRLGVKPEDYGHYKYFPAVQEKRKINEK